MSDRTVALKLPRGVFASAMAGATGGGIAWGAIGLMGTLTTSYARLDQLAALCLGALSGALVLGSRERRQRRSVARGVVEGALLGGVGALLGASLLVFGRFASTPRSFLVERAAVWALVCTGATAFVVLLDPRVGRRWIGESAAIAAVGGSIAGVIFTLPTATELWHGVACAWAGATIGLAICGPELWRGFGVIELLPAKGNRWRPWQMMEWPLHDNTTLPIGAAAIAVDEGSVTLLPPAGGAQARGHTVRRVHALVGFTIIVVGRSRYAVQVFRR